MSISPELALYSSNKFCARTDTVFSPISQVCTRGVTLARRLNYLQNILKRSKDELTWKVYKSQKSSPSKGNWTNIVQEDMGKIVLKISDNAIAGMNEEYKDRVKSKVRINALK